MQREAQEERRAGDAAPAAVRTGWRDWFSRGACEKVIVEARTALRSDPANPEARYWLGRCYQVLALRILEQLVESDPESYRAHQLLAQGLASQGEREKALAEYRAVEKRKPGLPGLHFAMGELLWMLNREDAAAEEFARELSLNPRHAEAGAALGTVLVSRYEPEQAVPVLERALKLNPGLSEARRELGRAYFQLQQYEKAEVQLRQVLERDGDGSTHYLLGNVYRELGRMEDAERVLNKVADLKARSGPPPMKEP
jgi:tetratricopeptide (TPR) repeat protein